MPHIVEKEGFQYGPYPDEMSDAAIKADIDSKLSNRAAFRKTAIPEAQKQADKPEPILTRFRRGFGIPATLEEMQNDPVKRAFEHPSVGTIAPLMTGPLLPV